MSVRFAEVCPENPLSFKRAEDKIYQDNTNDGITQKDRMLICQQDIFIGVFFDGTNNNKYRDTPSQSHSNVARLYEVYPGTNAQQTAPKFLDKINPDGSKTAREAAPDMPFPAKSVPPDELPYYRKIYVPGLGTTMLDVQDSGRAKHKENGLAYAWGGQARLDWAMLQLCNQVHAAVFKMPLEQNVILKHRELNHPYDMNQYLPDYLQRLKESMDKRGKNKPLLRKIRLSVFGFSRGAALARSWVNMITQRLGGALAGIPLQIDFLGLFDTVASVGIAQSAPGADGHFAWASGTNMVVPAQVKRCVHLAAAFEVRGSFPLDSICQGDALPSNCKEIIYPGVHSDVGGGYAPGDQGRALRDDLKVSQIALAQMYREARMAGVPLAPSTVMTDKKLNDFKIAPQLLQDFNAYIKATRSGSVPPTNGQGDPQFAYMFPTETQPRESLLPLVRRHYGYQLQWRKQLLAQQGGIAALPSLQKNPLARKYQDIEDLRGAEDELRREIAFLNDPDPSKFKKMDDLFLDKVIGNANWATSWGTKPLAIAGSWYTAKTIAQSMQEKQSQWDSWLKHDWRGEGKLDGTQAAAAAHFFEHYVHDSRAWFKPFMRSDGKHEMVADDETWFTFGARDKERRERISKLRTDIEKYKAIKDAAAVARLQKELEQLEQPGQPLLIGAREPYRMWGYVRHRRIYQSGTLTDATYASKLAQYDRDEKDRIKNEQREKAIAAEKERHAKAIKELKDKSNAAIQRTDVANRTIQQDEEYQASLRRSIVREMEEHKITMEKLKANS